MLNRIDKKEAKEANKEDADEWRRVMKSEATGETSLAELDPVCFSQVGGCCEYLISEWDYLTMSYTQDEHPRVSVF